jgi:hypothetical protein
VKKALFIFFCILFISATSWATIFFTLGVTPATCINVHNGIIVINSPTGGTAPYQYSINGGLNYSSSATFSSLAAGNYNVMVMDALGDTGSQPVAVTAAGFTNSSSINAILCSNDLPYHFNGTDIFVPGSYSDTLTNVTGCDSIVTLDLSIIPSPVSVSNISICPSQLPYTWNGQQYNIAGVYNVTFPTSLCDSVATLVLNVMTTDEWLGTINSSWEEPLNWSCGVPGPASDVIINSGTVILHGDTIINSLTLSASATLTINPGVHLTVLH